MKIFFLKAYILLTFSAFFASCVSKEKKETNTADKHEEHHVQLTAEQAKTAGIKTSQLETVELSRHIKVSGKIDVPPQNMVSVSAPLGGFLKDSKLLPGMHLSKGEVIAVMQDQAYIQLQQDYLSVKAEIEFSEKEYNRQMKLSESQASSNKAFEEAKAIYQKQKIQLNALAEKLRMINVKPESLRAESISGTVHIYSPIDGYVSKVNVNIGKYINPSEVMFELVNPADIHLNLTVFEKDVQFLNIGQKVKAFSSAKPDLAYPCEIILIGQDVSADRHVEVHCHFEKYDRSLIPGMYMNAEIQTEQKPVKAIAEDAVLSYDGKNYIFVEAGNLIYEMVEVKIGVSESGKVELMDADGLNKRNIVTEGAYSLLMKMTNTESEGHSH